MDVEDVVWEHLETTQLAESNVGGNEFSVSIKSGIMTNLQRIQEFLLKLVIIVVFTRLIIR